ncbi:DUF3307 domain-containing protein [Micromonospora sp. NPDC050795]|uniref:DUF3307 domain-containing protein n=1 Tax=Micromonospora sp. NPDC050795 TaxID=3364282 RepID=UPI0037B909DD
MSATLATAFVALYAAHQVADHWVQTQHQADHKHEDGWSGRWACTKHVATYTATAAVAILAAALVTGWQPNPLPLVAGLAVSAITHYIADRRTPLRWMADRLRKNPAWLERGGGLYALDQSWHVGWLFVAALIISV